MSLTTSNFRAGEIVVVLPCYNEAGRLNLEAFENFLRVWPNVAFLLVDDGSTDDTPLLLERLRQRVPAQVCTLRLSSNRGKAEAVRSGIAAALRRRPEIVGFWDADLSTPLETIVRMVEILRSKPHLQLIMGSRVAMLGREIRRKPWRHLLGRIFATAASMVLRLPVYDSQCGAKLIRVTPQTAEWFSRPFRARWIFDVELLARIRTHNSVGSEFPNVETLLYEYPLETWHDVSGSHLRLAHYFAAFGDLIAIYWRYMRAGTPLQDGQPNAIDLRDYENEKAAAA